MWVPPSEDPSISWISNASFVSSTTTLNLGSAREAISDAVTQWYEDAKKARLFELLGLVGGGKAPPADLVGVDQMWHDLATKVFDTTHDSPDFIIAVLKKFVWQVKRKIRNTHPGLARDEPS